MPGHADYSGLGLLGNVKAEVNGLFTSVAQSPWQHVVWPILHILDHTRPVHFG